jgi:hypothetical protein
MSDADSVKTISEESQCDAQLDFFANVATVATLMLGFNVTGIAISLQFTGDESFHLDDVLRLGRWAVLSTVTSTIGLVVSLVLYGHGRLMSGFSGQKAASAFFHKMLPLGFIAELSVLLSMAFFFNCMSEYILMQYIGPDICPVGSNLKEPRPSAFCSLLGDDFYGAAREGCTDLDDSALCKEFAKYNNLENKSFYFGWNPTISWGMMRTKSYWSCWFGWKPWRSFDQQSVAEELEETHAIIDQAANEYCRKKVLEEYMQASCHSSKRLSPAAQSREVPREKDFEDKQAVQEALALAGKEATVQNRTPSSSSFTINTSKVSSHSFASLLQVGHRTEVTYALSTDPGAIDNDNGKSPTQALVHQGQACAEAYTAFTHANSCVDGKTDDANRCLKVCSWVDKNTPTTSYLQKQLVRVNLFMGIIFFISVCARLVQYINFARQY